MQLKQLAEAINLKLGVIALPKPSTDLDSDNPAPANEWLMTAMKRGLLMHQIQIAISTSITWAGHEPDEPKRKHVHDASESMPGLMTHLIRR